MEIKYLNILRDMYVKRLETQGQREDHLYFSMSPSTYFKVNAESRYQDAVSIEENKYFTGGIEIVLDLAMQNDRILLSKIKEEDFRTRGVYTVPTWPNHTPPQ